MKKKKIIGFVIVLCLSVCMAVLYFQIIQPISVTVDRDVIGETGSSSENFEEHLKIWKEDDKIEFNLDAFSGEAPSLNALDYRQLMFEFTVTNRSLLGLQDMCVYVKDIDCENEKYAILYRAATYDEGGFEVVRVGKEDYYTPFIMVYVGDLTSEEEIQERLEDIAKHTTYQAICNMEWLGVRTYSFCGGDKLDGYVITDSNNNEKRIK